MKVMKNDILGRTQKEKKNGLLKVKITFNI